MPTQVFVQGVLMEAYALQAAVHIAQTLLAVVRQGKLAVREQALLVLQAVPALTALLVPTHPPALVRQDKPAVLEQALLVLQAVPVPAEALVGEAKTTIFHVTKMTPNQNAASRIQTPIGILV